MRALLALSLAGLVLVPRPAPSGDGRSLAIRAGKVHVGNGDVFESVLILVRDGKIVRIDKDRGELPAGFEVIDARNRVLIPGLVCADTDMAAVTDDNYAVTPDFVAADGFDFTARRVNELSGGVTTVYLSPSRNRLIAGQGSVVKLAGGSNKSDDYSRLLKASASLRIALNDAGKTAYEQGSTGALPVFEPEATPTADHPLKPARKQYPTARISQLAELRRVFAGAVTATNGDLLGEGPDEAQYDGESLRNVVAGKLPLRIASQKAADIRRALQFARSLNAAALLEDPTEAQKVADAIASAGVPVVLRIPVRPGSANPGDLLPGRNDPLPDPAAAAALARAGVRMALVPQMSADVGEMLMLAGVAVRYGLDAQKALAAVTLDAARILGVEARVGSLEPGKDADLVFLTGEPFDGRTVVERVLVEGSEVFRRSRSGNLLAVRAGTIHTGDGTVIKNGVVVIEDGRIVSVGAGTSIPFGAEIVDEPNAVVIPGLIDSSSRLGLHAEQGGLQAGSDVDLAGVVKPGDPVFQLALEAGVTTVLVNGDDSGLRSSRVSAIKTFGKTRDDIVVRATAGLRFVHDGVGPAAVEALRGELNRGKAYVDKWKAYEDALKAFREGKTQKKPEKEEAKPAEEKKPDPVSGTWTGSIQAQPIPQPLQFTMTLTLEGDKVSGTLQLRMGRQGQDLPISGTLSGTNIKLSATSPMGQLTLDATIEGNEMKGSFAAGPLNGNFTAQRGEAGSSAPAAGSSAGSARSDSGEPKEPQAEPPLEPYRDLFAGRIPAVVRSSNGTAIQDVMKVFLEEFKLPLVLVGASDVVDSPELLAAMLKGGEAPKNFGVQLGPRLVWKDKGKVTNAPSRFAYAGVPVALQTESTAGTRWLPVHAVQAVRFGLDSDQALKAMTSGPARLYKLDDRIGVLGYGRDGDLVLLSGDPFDLTTRVLAVVVKGKLAVDKRK